MGEDCGARQVESYMPCRKNAAAFDFNESGRNSFED